MTVSLTYTFGDATQLDKLFTTQLQADLDQIVADLNASDASIATLQGQVTTLQGQVTTLQGSFVSDLIKQPQNQDYRIIEAIPFGCTLTKFYAKTASGTCTAALKINTTAVTSGSINATSAQGNVTPSAANVMVANDTLVITVSANSNAVDLSYSVYYTRT
jgi:hypothetical protein